MYILYKVGISIGYQRIVDSEVKKSATSLSKPMIYVGWMEIGYDRCKTEEVFIRTP